MQQNRTPNSQTLPLRELLEDASREFYDLHDLTVIEEDAQDLALGSIEIKGSDFAGCSFLDSRFDGTGLDRVSFRNCDLSGCSFSGCGLREVTFSGCRMMGTNFTDCTLSHCRMEDCQGKYMGLVVCDLKHTVLEDCTLMGGSLSRSKLGKAKVDRCDFTRCDFSGAELTGLDFSRCTIEGATWTIGSLKNVTVTTAQAVELSRLMGLNIVP